MFGKGAEVGEEFERHDPLGSQFEFKTRPTNDLFHATPSYCAELVSELICLGFRLQ